MINLYPGDAWRMHRLAEAKKKRNRADKWIGRVIAWGTIAAGVALFALVAR